MEDLCDRAETDIAHYRGKYQAEMELPTDEKMAMEQVCAAYERISPVEVSRRLANKVSPSWVEKARRVNRRKPETGVKLEGWQGMSDEERRSAIVQAVRQGRSIRATAESYGIPRMTFYRQYGHLWNAS